MNGLQFYGAAPLTTSRGCNIGALCIVDKEPREFTESDQKTLASLASFVMAEIENNA
ncbi:GAF domain-containing protein [Rufibacter roseus]|uniref:GAF domain-containing protein n=1 Tax=Rufibacter roseus TaxID=1567108 RepID=A0ABW2DQL1_9BACT